MITVDDIKNVKTQQELFKLVEQYLVEIGQDMAARGEPWGETASRLNGDPVLELANRRWFEFEGVDFNEEEEK